MPDLPGRGLSPEERQQQDERFHQLRAAGASYATIAAEFGNRPHKRCLSRVNHRPHIARWHQGVETVCDGQNRSQSCS